MREFEEREEDKKKKNESEKKISEVARVCVHEEGQMSPF